MVSLSSVRRLLVAAIILEFLLLRVAIRVGPFVPQGAGPDALFSLLQTLGLAALNLIVLLGILVLGEAGLQSMRTGRVGGLLSGALALAAGGAVLGIGLVVPGSRGLSAISLLLVLAMAAALLFSEPTVKGRPYLLLPLSGYAALAGYYALNAGLTPGQVPPDSSAPYFLAEALMVAAGIAVPFFYHPPWRPRAAVIAAGVVAVFLALSWARPWMLATMVMWNMGFSLWLPAPVYGLGLGLFLYSLLALAGQGPEARRAAFGLLLMASAGLKLDYSPYALLALLGFVTLAWLPIWKGAAQPRTHPTRDRRSAPVSVAR